MRALQHLKEDETGRGATTVLSSRQLRLQEGDRAGFDHMVQSTAILFTYERFRGIGPFLV